MALKIDRFISIVVPVQNAEAYIRAFIDELIPVVSGACTDYEVIFIDDGSSDNTTAVLHDAFKHYPALRSFILSRYHGENIAISVGLDSAIGDYTIVMNPNTDEPQLIPQIIQRALRGADIVYGVDKANRRRGLAGVLSTLFHLYIEKFLHIQVPRNLTTLRCLSRHAINALTRISDSHAYYRYSASVIGFKSETFEYTTRPRDPRIQETSLSRAIGEGVQIITENSPHPLRVVTLLGVFLATANLIYMGYIIAIYLFKADVLEGWTTLSMQISVLFMAVILILTALSEYIGRILQKIQNRPAYFIKDERNSSVMIANTRMNVVAESRTVNIEKEIR